MSTYTVIGLVDNTADPRTLTVAGVVEGDVALVDVDPGDDESAQRWAEVVEAESPTEAEGKAHKLAEEEGEEE